MKELLNKRWAKENQTIREHTDAVIKEAERLIEITGICDKRLIDLLKIICEYHDYGKMNDEFQKRIQKRKKNQKCSFNSEKEVPHNILSPFFLEQDMFQDTRDCNLVTCAILYHHYHGDVGSIFRNNNSLINRTLLSLEDKVGKRKWKKPNLRACQNLLGTKDSEEILLKGLFHRCDYSASAGIPCELPNYFLIPGLQSLMEHWKKENPDAKWNELQQFCLKNQESNLIITAPTGMGKTEAGLLWIGDKKGFFVLPLRTAINAMYERICTHIATEKKEEEVALLHADTMSYYFDQNMDHNTEEDLLEYCVRSRQMSLPLTICTPDQIFDFVHQYPGYEYKLATLSYSKIIIDEIQMYNPELLAYLIYGIKRIHEMGGKVAVLTATLPPFVKMKLNEVLEEDIVEHNFCQKGILRHNVKVLETKLNTEDIYSFCKQLDEQKKNSKILVVCNSIEVAQKMYLDIVNSNLLVEYEPQLLHSHFTKKDRKKKEDAIVKTGKTTGPDYSECSKKSIWITTSIVEASLDLDFDFLFTELMDLMSLFQRLGRCNRKGLKDFSDYNCFVYTEKQGKAMDYVDQDIYRLSKEALLRIDGIISEEEKDSLIQKALSVEKLQDGRCDYIRNFNACYDNLCEKYTYEEDHKGLREIDTIQIIPLPVYEKNQSEIDLLENTLLQKGLPLGERIKAREDILQYTLSISKSQFRASQLEKRTITLSSKAKIPIIVADYNSELGFQMIRKEKQKVSGVFL